MNDTPKRTRRPAPRKDVLVPEVALPAAPLLPETGVTPISAAVTGALAVIAQTAAPDDTPAAAPAPAPLPRVKLVEARFSLPKEDHATLAELKVALRGDGVDVKKSQLLRVAVGLLRETDPARVAQLVAALAPAKKRK